jgi:hypothetical protein
MKEPGAGGVSEGWRGVVRMCRRGRMRGCEVGNVGAGEGEGEEGFVLGVMV